MTRKSIELKEYLPVQFSQKDIPEDIGEALWRNYRNQVAVEFPTPKTDWQWQLTAQGWVGYIPLSKELKLALQPKVELVNLFRMLEYAYRLKSFHFLKGLIDCQSISEFYERLAKILALRVIDRGRKGYYRAYRGESDKLPYIRGRINARNLLEEPSDVNIYCHYYEHTADVEENQILSWTLFCIARSGLCTESVLPIVRKAYRELQSITTLRKFNPNDCVKRLYNRLNQDYQPLHALCRFFLENSGPSHELGKQSMLPFLVDMERLYELFVAEWLKVHLPQGFEIKSQEQVDISNGEFHFNIDLVLYDIAIGNVRCVLDTKYKAPEKPSLDDIAQVVAYAEAKGCKEAILIYPTTLAKSIDTCIGDIRIRSLTFSLKDDLDYAGNAFLKALFQPELILGVII